MATNHARVTDPRWVRANIVIQRHRQGASIQCRTCHGSALTQRELADVVGVTLSQLTSFLHHGTGRPDVIAKIRAGVAGVVAG